jgi:hypothetical protein
MVSRAIVAALVVVVPAAALLFVVSRFAAGAPAALSVSHAAGCGTDDGNLISGSNWRHGEMGEWGTTGAFGPTGEAGPFGQLCVHFHRTGGTLDSIQVKVIARETGGKIDLYVFRDNVLVYKAHHAADGHARYASHIWSGTLSPRDWKGGCERGPYWIVLEPEDLQRDFDCRGN